MNLPNVVNVGSTIFIQEGELVTEVVELGDNSVRVICKNSCRLGEQRKMNLPGAQIDLPALTGQDETDIIEFGIPNDVDYITASFVRKASEVEYIRDVLASKNQNDMKIIAKIENQEGL